jgi:hypothetical protein
MLASHIPLEIAMINLFPFQIAMLVVYEQMPRGIVASPEMDIHAEYDQERSSSKGQVPKDLKKETKHQQMVILQTGRIE